MTVFATWWKTAAEGPVRLALPLLACCVALMACAEQDPPLVTAAPPPQAAPVDPLPASRPPLPDLGLIPLPTVEEVQRSAPAGRPDPFQPLPPIMAAGVDDADAEGGSAAVMDPMTGLMLSGLMQVGERSRALVETPTGRGALCVGADGRCDDDAEPLLPSQWSVLSIDVNQGCVVLAREGEPQEPICLS